MGLAGFGVGILVVGLSPASAFWLAVGGLFVVGMAIPMIDGPIFAVLQAKVAPEMQGRVFTLLHSSAKAAAPISLLVAGPIADRLGVQIWYVIAGLVCALMGVGSFFVPAIVNMEDEGNARRETAQATAGTAHAHPVGSGEGDVDLEV
jgi:DHA3 family macrolide efflux protein-like MFS transporter